MTTTNPTPAPGGCPLCSELDPVCTHDREPEPMTAPCECEHIDHFPDDRPDSSAHPYGVEVNIEDTTRVGGLTVCVHCASHCLKEYTNA